MQIVSFFILIVIFEFLRQIIHPTKQCDMENGV